MSITLRTELYETAQRVAEKKKLEAENHHKLVEEYLKDLCMKAASDGEFKVLIPELPLEDGTVLTDEEIRVFARDYDLDYTPHLPFLSWAK